MNEDFVASWDVESVHREPIEVRTLSAQVIYDVWRISSALVFMGFEGFYAVSVYILCHCFEQEWVKRVLAGNYITQVQQLHAACVYGRHAACVYGRHAAMYWCLSRVKLCPLT